MAKFTGFDIGLSGVLPLDVIIPCAQAAERLGFQRVWIAESYHGRGAFTNLAVVAQQTQSIGLGTGIISPYTRHPGILAMEAATLDEVSGGRFTLGLGTAYAQLNKHQVRDAKPITALREAIEMVRMLIRGEGDSYTGKVFTFGGSGVSLTMAPVRRDLPIYVGSMGPKTLEMASAASDGILLNFFLTPAFLKNIAMPAIRKGIERAGKDLDRYDIRSYIITSVDRDRRAANDAARGLIASYTARGASEPLRYQAAGIEDEERIEIGDRMRKYFDQGDAKQAEACVPDAWVDKLAVSGTPDDVCEKFNAFAAEGLKAPACYQVLGPNRLDAIELLAKEVVPHFL